MMSRFAYHGSFRFKRRAVTLGYGLLVALMIAGGTLAAQTDSSRLSAEEYVGLILRHHPVVRQAELQDRVAAAERLAGRAGFDPQLSGMWGDKYLDGTHYYRHAEGKLRIPTWLGVDLAAGYQMNTGTYVNPEERTDDVGLWSVGIEANLLQGLITDERRTARRQAEVFAGMAMAERARLLNEILQQALDAYADWQAAEEAFGVVGENLQRAQEYYTATLETWRQGANPAIDTLEAFLIVQDQQVALQAYDRERIKARQGLESFLWLEGQPAELQPGLRPTAIDPASIPVPAEADIPVLVDGHPDVVAKQLSIEQYALDLRLKEQKLLPKLKVKYYPLLTPRPDAFWPAYDVANYKWGFDLAMPLTFREARADAERAGIKQEMATFALQDKRNVLLNKAQATWQEVRLLAAQVEVEAGRIDNYSRLLDAEQERFSIGESSVFLLNKRQESYFGARIKWAELKAKNLKCLFALLAQTNGLVSYAGAIAPD